MRSIIRTAHSDPQSDILESTSQINLFLAGIGSGKTFLGGDLIYTFLQFPQIKGFLGANFYDQLNTSTFTRVAYVLAMYGIVEYSDQTRSGLYVVNRQPPNKFTDVGHRFISYQNIMTFWNGTTIFLGSLDNAKAHEGKEFGWAILDETKDSDEADVKEIILARLRQNGLFIKDGRFNSKEGEPINPLYILTSPAKVDWINKWFKLDDNIEEIENLIYSDTTYFKKQFDNKFCTISSTYHNQHNLPENFIENKRFDYSEERFKALIYANPFSQTGGEYYSSFSRLNHVKDCYLNKDLPIHITFDFNAVPYNTLLVFQIEYVDNIYRVRFIDEICLQNPHNSTEELCDTFMSKYQRQGLFIYGDATGRARTITNKLYKNQYEIIFNKLKLYVSNTSDRVPMSNKPNLIRRDFINKIFDNKLPIRVQIHKNLHTLINDLTYTKQGIDGLKDKKTTKDEILGNIQKWGHCGDAMEYALCEAFKNYM